jgi:hypothetical protein
VIKRKLLVGFLILAVAGATYYFYIYKRAPGVSAEEAYVIPRSVAVVNTTAAVRVEVATLRHGDRVEVLERLRTWARVRLPDGRTGWLDASALLDAPTYGKGEEILQSLRHEPVQAVGHTPRDTNLRVAPGRDAPPLALLPTGQRVEIFRRQLVDRPPQPGSASEAGTAREAWYLVRAEEEKAGWVLGRLVTLDIPEAIAHYAQSFNMVAWLVLNHVEDDGRQVPQYLVADRIGTQEVDFNHIRVFTWWRKRQSYATAYVESNLNGSFPIHTTQIDGVPYFRLRLEDRQGRRFQKVYRMQDTIVRFLGTVEGWESEAMPERPERKVRRVAAGRAGRSQR